MARRKKGGRKVSKRALARVRKGSGKSQSKRGSVFGASRQERGGGELPPYWWLPPHLRPEVGHGKPLSRLYGTQPHRTYPDRKTMSRQALGLAPVPFVDSDGFIRGYDFSNVDED